VGEKNKSGGSKVSPSRGAGGSVGGSRGGSEKRELGAVGSEVGKGVKRDERGEREGSLGECFRRWFLRRFRSESGSVRVRPPELGVGEVVGVGSVGGEWHEEERHGQEAFLA
jgi:hypothetical protein